MSKLQTGDAVPDVGRLSPMAGLEIGLDQVICLDGSSDRLIRFLRDCCDFLTRSRGGGSSGLPVHFQ